MKTSMRIRDELTITNGILKINHASANIVGEVTIQELDRAGNIVFSNTEYNDVTISGATFILEQMFKQVSSNARFKMVLPDGTPQSNIAPELYQLKEEKIFGFVVGIGGEDGMSVKNVNFTATKLDGFVPFRVYESGTMNDIDTSKYLLPLDFTSGNKTYKGYYVKKFTRDGDNNSINIIPEFTDGSGIVNSDNLGTTNSPIYTYAELILDISAEDIREYFYAVDGTLSNCRINQLGLVAGYPTTADETKFDDIRLVTILNFKGRDLSNNENTLRMRYKLYCI